MVKSVTRTRKDNMKTLLKSCAVLTVVLALVLSLGVVSQEVSSSEPIISPSSLVMTPLSAQAISGPDVCPPFLSCSSRSPCSGSLIHRICFKDAIFARVSCVFCTCMYSVRGGDFPRSAIVNLNFFECQSPVGIS